MRQRARSLEELRHHRLAGRGRLRGRRIWQQRARLRRDEREREDRLLRRRDDLFEQELELIQQHGSALARHDVDAMNHRHGEGPLLRHDVRAELFVPARIEAREHGDLAYARVSAERSRDLGGLDANASDLHLLIDAPRELDAAIGEVAASIAGPIEPRAGLFAEGIGDEPLGRQRGPLRGRARGRLRRRRSPDRRGLELR